MLGNDTFVISFNEMSAVDIGDAIVEDPRSDNYYADPFDRATMCCGCDKPAQTIE
jgi:hypothetical protein